MVLIKYSKSKVNLLYYPGYIIANFVKVFVRTSTLLRRQ